MHCYLELVTQVIHEAVVSNRPQQLPRTYNPAPRSWRCVAR